MNAAEKARKAREARQKENQAKRKNRMNGVKDFFSENFYKLIMVASIIIGIIVFVLQLIGVLNYSTALLKMEKVTFFVSFGAILIMLVALGFCGDKGDETFCVIGFMLQIVTALALLVCCCMTLFSGRFSVKSFYVNEEYGVVYAEQKTEYTVWKIFDGREDVLIETSHDGMTITKIKNRAAKGNNDILNLAFENGDITVGKYAFQNCARLTNVQFADNSEYVVEKKAFKNCIRLEKVTFGDSSVCSLYENVFEECIGLKEFNVGSAKVGCAGDNNDYNAIFGGSTNATVYIDGGSLGTICDSIGKVFCGNNSSLVLGEGYIKASENHYPVLKTLVFTDGFDFADGEYKRYYTTGFWNDKYNYYSVAEEIYLPSSITHIPDYFFGDIGNIGNIEGGCKVYYAGTEEEWNNLTIGSSCNSNYRNGKVTVVYNSSYSKEI